MSPHSRESTIARYSLSELPFPVNRCDIFLLCIALPDVAGVYSNNWLSVRSLPRISTFRMSLAFALLCLFSVQCRFTCKGSSHVS
jgi:hypothetical protein